MEQRDRQLRCNKYLVYLDEHVSGSPKGEENHCAYSLKILDK